MPDSVHGNFQLAEHHARVAYRVHIFVNILRRDESVRTWSHNDCIFAVRRDSNHGNSRRSLRDGHTISIDSAAQELRAQLFAKRIGADPTNHANRIAKLRHSDGLIRSLSARVHLKIAAVNSFSDEWNAVRARDEVNVYAADDDDRFLVHVRLTIPGRRRARLSNLQRRVSSRFAS